jgi:antitoxin HigA-1
MRKKPSFPPIHPGETLREDFLAPLQMSVNSLAMELHVPATRMNEIARGRRAISADTALRLGRFFGTSPQFWMNLQANYELEMARDVAGERIEAAVRPRVAA